MSKEADKLYYKFLTKQYVHRQLVWLNDWIDRGCPQNAGVSPYLRMEVMIANYASLELSKYLKIESRSQTVELYHIAKSEMLSLMEEYGLNLRNFENLTDGVNIYDDPDRRGFIKKYGSRDARDFLPVQPHRKDAFVFFNKEGDPFLENQRPVVIGAQYARFSGEFDYIEIERFMDKAFSFWLSVRKDKFIIFHQVAITAILYCLEIFEYPCLMQLPSLFEMPPEWEKIFELNLLDLDKLFIEKSMTGGVIK